MSFKVDGGLFKFDFTDYHAILGVAVDADAKEIRRRYLKIARRLHPDSGSFSCFADKELAGQLLSKLVNPAYEKLSRSHDLAEYILLLSGMGGRLVQESTAIDLRNQLSQQLFQTHNIDSVYKTSLHKLAETQYDELEHAIKLIAQLSELNLVYLVRKADTGNRSHYIHQPIEDNVADTPPLQQPESPVIQHFQRTKKFIAENNLFQARVELQEAIKIEPNNSRCYSLMGVVYLKQNQVPMAKVYLERALKLNPQDETALAGKKQLEQMGLKIGGKTATSSESHQTKSSTGGVFGSLFGRKNK
ncbi:MAG: J domain-containing protein [Chroococcidiopsidaceae cyanobacterium CP_BM_ER_R8_30]|nr:J domain-containing protein [Chroococcidiopsidaceae cyanobacterium CP_BM_ER_R8_30]